MITIKRLLDKLNSLGKECGCKSHFFNPVDALMFTCAPYLKRGNQRKHRKIVDYISKYCEEKLPEGYSIKSTITNDCPYWVFWYQGLENAPELIKSLHNQLLRCKGLHKVIMLDKNNLSQYVELPDYVWDKVALGTITLTHLSDLVRMSLLSNWGGYWIDATILLSKPIPDYTTSYYSIRSNTPNPRFPGGGNNWSAYFIGTGEKNAIAKYILDAFLNYWKKEKYMIDYFLVDYFTYIAFEKFPEFKQIILSNPIDNPNASLLQHCFNDEYSEVRWDGIFNSQVIHKLSYKLPIREGNTIWKHIVKEL